MHEYIDISIWEKWFVSHLLDRFSVILHIPYFPHQELTHLNIYMYYHPCGETNNSKPTFINILHKIIYMLVYFLYSIAFLKHAIFFNITRCKLRWTLKWWVQLLTVLIGKLKNSLFGKGKRKRIKEIPTKLS